MAEPICDLTELPVSMCAHCRQQQLPQPGPLRWFTAQYRGRCANCGDPIDPGDEIAATEDGYVCCTREL
ncbi:hypothetical protein [Nocardia wallacei]|uniref:hypothetical protein n=1 Tax=Nocardia wallacei TaxID=480035 RepID=UPI002455A10D|nr:hypothetical protein [Nocardia wallacei]